MSDEVDEYFNDLGFDRVEELLSELEGKVESLQGDMARLSFSLDSFGRDTSALKRKARRLSSDFKKVGSNR